MLLQIEMKALVLLSGGFDSPVAAHLMQQKGVEMVGLHFSYEPITDDGPEKKVRAVCNVLGIKRLIVIKAGHAFADVASKCEHRLYYILSKRLMLRIAEQVARECDCVCIVTGENLAQVGSQTLPNLRTIDGAIGLHVMRPLLCWDKVEILEYARKIGTYEISKGPEVCDCLGPVHPATTSTLVQAEREEAKLGDLLQSDLLQREEVSF